MQACPDGPKLTRIDLAKRFCDGLLPRRWFTRSVVDHDDFAQKVVARVFDEIRDVSVGCDVEDWRAATRSICDRWGRPDLGRLAVHLGEQTCDHRPYKGFRQRECVESVVVAILTAAERLVRRGKRVRIPRLGVELAATVDYWSVRKLANGSCTEAPVAVRALASPDPEHWPEPWNWDLVREADHWHATLTDGERHQLLARLAQDDTCGLGLFRSEQGSRWDSERTQPYAEPAAGDDGLWIVLEVGRQGIRTADAVICKERARIGTVDAMILFDGTCPVGRWLRRRRRDLIPGGQQGCRTWRARYGFYFPGDLRDEFDETTLAEWRKRMIREVNAEYVGCTTCQLDETGSEGDRFEQSTMEVRGSDPEGDAFVTGLVERDGIAQHGLACKGGNPLLLAVVRAETR